uniref:gasdermin-C n=1 Tax=Ictidomys tridecemlineatus TaxID=43179 RepID=UPI001A9D8333|nr:gasdermin-C [Ictidomys tridecemlineatus]XP_040149600.1 gasdermin-C [Ictidomys tridecemlineatus]
MPSIFERVSKKMVKNFGGKDLRPVKSLLDATHFRQFSILRKNPQSQFWEQPDIPVECSLMDILAPGSSVPEVEVTRPFFFSDTVIQKWKAGMSASAGVDGGASGEFTQSRGSTLEFQKVTVPSRNLERLQNSKLLDPEPSFLKHCRERGDNLYVVTEVVELTNSTTLHDKSSVTTLGKLSGSWNILIKGEVQGQIVKDGAMTLTIPQGTVMAYKKKQLVIKGNGVTFLLISTDAKHKTFQDELLKLRSCSRRRLESGQPVLSSLSVGRIEEDYLQGRIEEPFCPEPGTGHRASLITVPSLEPRQANSRGASDFKHLQEEVFRKIEALAQLSKGVQDDVFNNILPMLGDRGALQDLMDVLDLDSWDHLKGPGSIILNKLRQDSSPPWVKPQDSILYLLQAMMVLSDTQLELLALSMEKRILLWQRELVRVILEPNFKYPWSIPFTLPPELLAPLQGEGLAITYGLLEECGLKMELSSPRSTWDLEAKMPLSALYGTLSLLQQLAEA